MPKDKKTDGKPVIYERVACDYLSLTTFDSEVWYQWQMIVESMELGEPTGAAFAQYSGLSYDDSVKLVEGVQGSEMHHMATVSGANADVFLRHLVAHDSIKHNAIKCTRIDIQLTKLPVTDRPRLSVLAQRYQDKELGEYEGQGRPKTYAYAGDDGDTWYSGSGTSDKLLRIYDKRVTRNDGSTIMTERAELQLRHTRAQSVFERVISHKPEYKSTPMKGALKAYLDTLPSGLKPFIAACGVSAIDGDPIKEEHTRRGGGPKTKWINTIQNAVGEACSQVGADGRYCREMMLKQVVRGLRGNGVEDTGRWTLVSPDGTLYTVEGKVYTDDTRTSSVTIQNITNSDIKIQDIAGRSIIYGPQQETVLKSNSSKE